MKNHIITIILILFSTSAFANVTDMPLKHEAEAEALDAIIGVKSVATLLNRKNPNRIEIYKFVKNNMDTMGTECGLEICKQLRFSMKRLEDIAQDPNNIEAIKAAGESLKLANKASTELQSKETYKITKKKPLFIHDGVYAVHSDIASREQCKLFGDALHITKKQAIITFVKPGKSISKDVTAKDLSNINCIYRYNYGLKNYTQVLINEEIKSRWP